MKNLYLGIILPILFLFSQAGISQCASWVGNSNEDEIAGWHSIYRQAIKAKDYATAYEYWKQAYEAAPAADGRRDFHYLDGVKLYMNMFNEASDDATKSEYSAKILSLYDECFDCYKERGIALKCSTDECYDAKLGYVLGRKAYDMYYHLRKPYSETFTAFQEATNLGGNSTEYIVLTPFANVTVYQYQQGIIDKLQAREVHTTLNGIADHNIENNERFKVYYEQAKAAMNAEFSQIERDIFDCAYFKEKLRPEYEADPENPDVIKSVLAVLKGQGCEAGDPMYDELDAKWKKYAAVENARIQAEFEANNPNVMAKKLYDQGDFEGAAAKYRDAISAEPDPEKQASYYFSLASIEFRKLSQYTKARNTARQAAKLKPGWGRPYMLIGDMYGKSARSCGDSWNQRLAILAALDKYAYAKSIDPEVAEEANKKMGIYRGSMPAQDEGFMRGIKAGQTVTVACWIGETVKVRYK